MNRIKFENCRYVFAAMLNEMPSDRFIAGWVEIGGDPANPQGAWAVGVKAEKRKGLFSGYSIQEDTNYPGGYKEVESALTLSRARDKVIQRLLNAAETVSQKYGLPIVNFDERCRLKDGAEEIALQRFYRK